MRSKNLKTMSLVWYFFHPSPTSPSFALSCLLFSMLHWNLWICTIKVLICNSTDGGASALFYYFGHTTYVDSPDIVVRCVWFSASTYVVPTYNNLVLLSVSSWSYPSFVVLPPLTFFSKGLLFGSDTHFPLFVLHRTCQYSWTAHSVVNYNIGFGQTGPKKIFHS